MSLVSELAASVQCCFELFATQSDGILLSRNDQSQLSEISSILQPVLLRLQKQAVAVAETQELFAEDEQLLRAIVRLRRALEGLQSAVDRAKVQHWLVRVLLAEDVRTALESALQQTAGALQDLMEAEAAADAGPLQEIDQLQQSLLHHKVTRQEPLERLGTGLYKHMEAATDAEQVVAMLRFVVREAQNLVLRRKDLSRDGRTSSSSRRLSDASDTSNSRDQNNAAAAAATAMETSSGGATSSSDDGSNSSIGSGSNNNKGSSGSKSSSSRAKPSDIPPGETSLTDVQLMLTVQELADSKQGTQQLVLHQILSILEELHEHKASHLKRKALRNQVATTAGALQSVPEGADDATIAAVRDAQQTTHTNGPTAATPAAIAAAAAAAGGEQQPPLTYGAAVAAMTSGLEEMLWADPWDSAALTQLLELLMQAASADEEYVDMDQDSSSGGGGDDSSSRQRQQQQHGGSSGSSGSSSSSGKASSSSGGGRKWWGQMGAAAKAALQTARSSSFSAKAGKGSSSGSSKLFTRAADEATSKQEQELQRRRRERLHQLVTAALDVLLRLTLMPADCDSFLRPVNRPDLTPHRSLALPLMAHPDTPAALAACIWSTWHDVEIKAARLLSMLICSETAVMSSDSSAAAVGLAASPASIYLAFCHTICSTGGSRGSNGGGSSSNGAVWPGMVTLLHSNNQAAAGAAAEALAAIGSSSRSGELCSSLAATQAARALLLLLAKHALHPGAAGAAAAALQALAEPRLRPAMHELLVNSYTEPIPNAPVPLGDTLVAIMLGPDSLAACRAACLAATLASGVSWHTAAVSSSSGSSGSNPGSLWCETFRAGQHLLQRSRSSSSGSSDQSLPSLCGAQLLHQLVDQGYKGAPPVLSYQLGNGSAGTTGNTNTSSSGSSFESSRDSLCFEALQLTAQKLQGCDLNRHGRCGLIQALIQLLSSLVSHTSDDRMCGMLPELCGSVVPLLEDIQRKGGSGSLQRVAQRLREQLMELGG